jgi:ABC-2 type transport system permease protein
VRLHHLIRQEIRYLWRSRRLVAVLVVLTAFGMLSPVLARYMREFMSLVPEGEQIADLIPEPTAADAISQYMKNMGQFGVALALLLAMGAVAREKERGTAALVLVKPVGRGEFIFAKFVALGVAFAVGGVAAAACCYYYMLVLFEPVEFGSWLALNALLLLFLLVHMALTLLFSTLARSQALAGGLALGLAVILAAAGSLPTVGEYLPGELLAWGARLARGVGSSAWPALAVSIGLIGAALAAAVAGFRRQEL